MTDAAAYREYRDRAQRAADRGDTDMEAFWDRHAEQVAVAARTELGSGFVEVYTGP